MKRNTEELILSEVIKLNSEVFKLHAEIGEVREEFQELREEMRSGFESVNIRLDRHDALFEGAEEIAKDHEKRLFFLEARRA